MPDMDVFTSYGRSAGSARVRAFDWLDHIGTDARVHDYIGTSSLGAGELARKIPEVLEAEARTRILARRREFDRVLVSRAITPFSRGSVEAKVLARARHSVYDFDDAIMVEGRGVRSRLFPQSQVWRSSVAAADTVIAGNNWLAERAAELARDVRVIPSCVELSRYRAKEDYSIGARPQAVWIGSHSTEKYLSHIAGALNELHTRHGLVVNVISSGIGGVPNVADGAIRRSGWSIDTFADELTKADFGIMPLTDSEWERGKCAYKILQYGAAALPIVASPVGANIEALEKLSGTAALGADSWVESCEFLIELTEEGRKQAGLRARAGVERDYSFSRWRAAWKSAVGL